MSLFNYSSLRRRRPRGHMSSTPDSKTEDQMPLLRADGICEVASSSEPLTPSLTRPLTIDPRHRVPPSWYLGSDCSSPDTPRRIQYCAPCRQERASPGYIERVSRLIDRLYCAGCHLDHPAILFSHPARKTEPRRCIAHEGFRTVCPHLKLSLQDIEQTNARTKDLEERCQEPTCPCTDATITYDPVIGCVALAWSIRDDETQKSDSSSDSSLECDRARLRDLHQSFPSLFCSHLQVSPERLFHPDASSIHSHCRLYSCKHCLFSVSIEEDGGSRTISSSRFVRYWDIIEGIPRKHVELLDPNTYGHFEDPDTKHITWCDDRSCATTCELVTLSVLISLTNQYTGDWFRISYGLGMNVLDTTVHSIFGFENQGSDWRERYSWKAWAKNKLVNLWNAG